MLLGTIASAFAHCGSVEGPHGLQVKELALFVSHELGGANAYDDQPGAYEEYMRQVHTLRTLPRWVQCGV